MLSVNCVRHINITLGIILHKRIKTASLHIRLQNYLAFLNIRSVYFQYSYMVAVYRCVEKIKPVFIHKAAFVRVYIVACNRAVNIAKTGN